MSDDERKKFDEDVAALFEQAGFKVWAGPIVGGEQVDAVVQVGHFVDGTFKAHRSLVIETRYSKRPAKYSLRPVLTRLAYLRGQGLAHYAMLVVNYDILPQDEVFAAELVIPVRRLPELAEDLKSRESFLPILEPQMRYLIDEPHGFFDSNFAGVARASYDEFVLPEKPLPARKQIFVAIHYSDHNADVYNYGISKVAQRLEMQTQRAMDVEHNELIIENIWAQIEAADIVIADLTDDNQNVYNEAGYAHALKKPVILIAQEGTKIRFDLAGSNCILFRNISDLDFKLDKRLVAMDATKPESSA